MTEEEAKDILFKIKKDNESKAMIIHNNSSNIQISWSNEDLKDMARIQQRCANNVRAIDIILTELDSKDTEINKLNNVIDELVGEVAALNYETIGEWCNKDKGDKCKKCDTNNHDCIKEYFMKENFIGK